MTRVNGMVRVLSCALSITALALIRVTAGRALQVPLCVVIHCVAVNGTIKRGRVRRVTAIRPLPSDQA